KRPRQSETPIVGTAAAEPNDNAFGPATAGQQNHLTNTKGGRAERVVPVGDSSPPRGFGHIEHRQLLRFDPGISALNHSTERIVYGTIHLLALQSSADDFSGSFTAIRERH